MDSLHLCQPDEYKSCGACCGLYNYRDSSRLSLKERIEKRTREFQRISDPSADTLEEFSQWVCRTESHGKLLETIYNCEFLGFLDPDRCRVGCLLHPAQHQGQDFRSCSFYGAELCAGHLCLSYQKLTQEEKWCVINSLDDWHLYGICVTDIDFCKTFFALAAARLGGQPSLTVLSRPQVRQAAFDFFSLKVNWPFRTDDQGRFGKYCLAEDEYREARIPYEELGCPHSQYDAILLSLASHFSSADEMREAESLIDQRLAAFVHACE